MRYFLGNPHCPFLFYHPTFANYLKGILKLYKPRDHVTHLTYYRSGRYRSGRQMLMMQPDEFKIL